MLPLIKQHIEKQSIKSNLNQFFELQFEIDNKLLKLEEYENEYNFLVTRIYLEYLNNFLTLEKFAAHYSISEGATAFIFNKAQKIKHNI